MINYNEALVKLILKKECSGYPLLCDWINWSIVWGFYLIIIFIYNFLSSDMWETTTKKSIMDITQNRQMNHTIPNSDTTLFLNKSRCSLYLDMKAPLHITTSKLMELMQAIRTCTYAMYLQTKLYTFVKSIEYQEATWKRRTNV